MLCLGVLDTVDYLEAKLPIQPNASVRPVPFLIFCQSFVSCYLCPWPDLSAGVPGSKELDIRMWFAGSTYDASLRERKAGVFIPRR